MFKKYLEEQDKQKMLSATYNEMKAMSYEGLCAVAEKLKMDIVAQADKPKQLQAMYKEMKNMDEKLLNAMYEASCGMKEDNSNDKSDDGEGLDKVQPKAVKKKFADRKDKDIDNDGDVDSSDEYLHKRRKAVSKAVAEAAEKEEREECPKCKGKGCDHCDNKGYHVVEESADLEGLDEAVKTTHVLVDTSKGNKVVAAASSEKGVQQSKASAKRPPMSIKDTSVLKIVTLTKPQSEKATEKMIGYPLAKGMDKFPTNTSATQGKRMGEELDEAPRRKRAPKMKGDSIKIQRAKDAEHNKAMGRTKTGRKKPVRTMTSTQRSLASMREGVEQLDELSAEEKRLMAKMYDKKGNLTPLGKKVMDHGKKADDAKVADKARRKEYNAYQKSNRNEEVSEAKKPDYTIYHKSFSSAVQHALSQVEKQGFSVDEDEWGRKVAMGPRKPGKGKTNSYTIDLMKGDKETRKKLQMQVYYDEGRYELNMYVS